MADRRLRVRGGLIGLIACVLVAACGGATPAQATPPAAAITAVPTAFAGQVISLSAKNLQFSEKAVTVKAGADFEITLDNRDEFESHAIYVTPGKRPLAMQTLEQYENGPYPFKGEYAVAGQSVTYHVGALSPGAYQFFCPPHLDMVISVTVE